VESYRTAQGPRQRVVSYVGALEDGEVIAPVGRPAPADLFRPPAKPRRIEIDPDRVEVRRCREFGGV